MVCPGSVHRARCCAVFHCVPVPAGHHRQLAGVDVWQRMGRAFLENRTGRDRALLYPAERLAGSDAGPHHQCNPSTGRGSRLARLYDAPPERAVRPAQRAAAGRYHLGRLALAADVVGGI